MQPTATAVSSVTSTPTPMAVPGWLRRSAATAAVVTVDVGETTDARRRRARPLSPEQAGASSDDDGSAGDIGISHDE